MDVIRFFNELADCEEKLSKTTHKICRNIIQGLDESTLIDLRYQANLDWYLLKLINHRLEKQATTNHIPTLYNKSWRTYLKDLQQRKLGQVSFSRKKLQEIFPHLEWQAQCKVLAFFLTEPSKGSRVWALNTLADHWYLFEGRGMQFKEAWLAKVLGLWDQYKEKEVALFIVNYANEDCVLKMEQDLSKIIGYQKVALRLGGNPNYEINQSALSSLEWLYVMAKLRRPIDVAVCEAILNTMLVDAIKNESLPSSLDGHEFSFALDNQVGLALWCLGELKQPELIMRFFRCDRELQEHLAPWLDRGLSQEEYWRLMCREAPKYFPLPLLRERKREELKALIDCYPILQSLIEKFGLELI